jgi:ribonuclease PH
MRHDQRQPDQLRPVKIKRGFTKATPGSTLIRAGRTVVLCTASIEPGVPPWMAGQQRGWITAEYNMLPGSTSPRKRRDRGTRSDGRTVEIQRLVGRSLRAVADLNALGEQTVTVDCDVLEADAGTRTLSITGAFVSLVDALWATLPSGADWPLRDSVAAVSVGMIEGRLRLDLEYEEDVVATVDTNVVMTGTGQLVEVQAAGEEATFTERQLSAMLKLARSGIAQLTDLQKTALGKRWPFD